jgi:predicted nucleotidyltransferase
MDRFIRSLFLSQGLREKAGEILEERIALAALGSYGRREICLGSDVDLLVVHKDRLSPEMSEIISHVLHCLWDAKLDVGHSVLTVQECNRLAMSDFRFLTSVLDARFLLGSRSFYRLFQAAFWSKLDREKRAVLKQFLIHQQKRQEKFSNEEYFVEPDIKEGLGGLRDLHFMTWTAKIFFASKRLREIKRFPVFPISAWTSSTTRRASFSRFETIFISLQGGGERTGFFFPTRSGLPRAWPTMETLETRGLRSSCATSTCTSTGSDMEARNFMSRLWTSSIRDPLSRAPSGFRLNSRS